MTTVYKYKIYCTTESKYVEGFGTTSPTVCYNNNSHSVVAGSVQIMEVVSTAEMKIKEDSIVIGRNPIIQTIKVANVAPLSSSYSDFKFDGVTSMYSFMFCSDDLNIGDELSVAVNPHMTLGLIGADITAGATTFIGPAALLAYGSYKFYIRLTNGTITEDIGYIKSIDKVTGVITMSQAITNNFLASNTLVQMTYYTMKDLIIGPAGMYRFGDDIVGGAAVPINTVVRVTYKNNATNDTLDDEPKTFVLYLTLLV